MDVSLVVGHYDVLVEVQKRDHERHHGGFLSRIGHHGGDVSVPAITFVDRNTQGGGRRLTIPVENGLQVLVFSSPQEAQGLLKKGSVIVQKDDHGVHQITESVVKMNLPKQMPESGHLLVRVDVDGDHCKVSCTQVRDLKPVVVTHF